jgi:hypothetical protein
MISSGSVSLCCGALTMNDHDHQVDDPKFDLKAFVNTKGIGYGMLFTVVRTKKARDFLKKQGFVVIFEVPKRPPRTVFMGLDLNEFRKKHKLENGAYSTPRAVAAPPVEEDDDDD